jgi:hypothetical protein
MERGDLQHRRAARGSPGAPALLAGTGKDQVHLLLVCTGERGLSGASTPRSCVSPASARWR